MSEACHCGDRLAAHVLTNEGTFCLDCMRGRKNRRASPTKEEMGFTGAAEEWNRIREAMSNFGKDPTTHFDSWHALSHSHAEAEKEMRAAYRRLVSSRTGPKE